jgi:1-acyl-sn-glycerol-3-phosphate acyltransferase
MVDTALRPSCCAPYIRAWRQCAGRSRAGGRASLAILNVADAEAGDAALGSIMIAANHVSWLDIFVISSVRPTRFIARGDIRRWPIVGWIADRAGTLFIQRDQWRDTARINATVRSVLDAGDCVGLFPEGITTEGDRLLKFHSALFEPAVANGARVQAAAIRYEHADGTLCRDMSFFGERTFMQSLTLIIGQPAVCVRLAFLPPIAAGGSTRRAVASAAAQGIATRLGIEPAGTPR